MTESDKAVMQQALDALGLYLMAGHGNSTDFTKQGAAYNEAIECIADLGAAIAQPEQPAQRNLISQEKNVLHKALIKSGKVIAAIAQPKDKP